MTVPEESVAKETFAEPIVIDLTLKPPSLDKKGLLSILRAHGVKTRAVENSDVQLEDVIPTLRKAKTVLPEAFFRDLSSQLELPFLKHAKIKRVFQNEQKSKLIPSVPYQILSKYKFVPTRITKSTIDVAVDNPLDSRVRITLQSLFSKWNINLHVATSDSIEWAIDKIYRESHKEEAMVHLYNRNPDQSACKVLFPNQKYFIISLLVIIVVAALANFSVAFAVLCGLVSFGYFIVNPIKIYVSVRGFKGSRPPTRITIGEMQWVLDEDLPVYTVLIPVFHEEKVLSQIMKNMYLMNYPKDKLDIKLLIEETDEETIREAQALGLFGSTKKMAEGIPQEEYAEFLKLFDPIIIPASKITTKPRACNYGLIRAIGEICVIYDAEDKPDPDQLRKAAIVFLRQDQNVVCLQSKLNFYNSDENILTKWFSIEYGNWYEFYLQGLDWINAPIPLGGTSNHFRKKALDEMGRWDPYNVTEDADVGIRLARQKLRTEMIDSYTYEEATLSLGSWIRQRSRWYKGHLQTYLVHMRYPKKLAKDLGAKQFLKFQLTFGAGIFIPIINPILWILTAFTLLFPAMFTGLIPTYLEPICVFNLLVGNLTYLLIYVIACIKMKKYRIVHLALLMPAYWALVSCRKLERPYSVGQKPVLLGQNHPRRFQERDLALSRPFFSQLRVCGIAHRRFKALILRKSIAVSLARVHANECIGCHELGCRWEHC